MTTSSRAAGDLAEPVVAYYLGKIGADRLAQKILGYWRGLGHAQVRVWIEPDAGTWSIRSNLQGGRPPPATT